MGLCSLYVKIRHKLGRIEGGARGVLPWGLYKSEIESTDIIETSVSKITRRYFVFLVITRNKNKKSVLLIHCYSQEPPYFDCSTASITVNQDLSIKLDLRLPPLFSKNY
jgi:hypothetical protein